MTETNEVTAEVPETADAEAEASPAPLMDEGDHHWLHVDPNGDWWLEHPHRHKDMIDSDCHHDLTQCPVHLFLAHRFLKHPTFNFGATWDRTRRTPGAPHHTRFRVVETDGATDEIVMAHASGEEMTFTVHEHGPEHGHEIVDVDGVEHVRYPCPWNVDQSHQQFERGQRAGLGLK